ncbi:3-isopropylmalate dehydrogenase [bacterium]|nr:3-isopropylmalate dehydrogenase [bacterium]
MAYDIGIIKGDGTGPEVVNEAIKVLNKVSETHSLTLNFTDLPYDGQRYIDTGKTLTDDELEGLKQYNAILLGAIGHPDIKPGILERGILLKLRFELDQYINLRPIKLFQNVYTPIKNKTPDDIDYVVVRENTGGLYTGHGGCTMKNTEHEVAEQAMVYSRHQVERCVRFAFEHAKKRHADKPWKGLSEKEINEGKTGKVTLCGKSNVLQFVYDLWLRVMEDVGKEFPEIAWDYVHVDAVCIYMIECPERFDIIVTGNMFGDIITDLAAVTQGGMGIAPSGNINPNGTSMFEPIGGTAPSFTGQNAINPCACILAAAMMLDHLGETDASKNVVQAVEKTVLKMDSMLAAKMGMTTTDVGSLVCENLISK